MRSLFISISKCISILNGQIFSSKSSLSFIVNTTLKFQKYINKLGAFPYKQKDIESEVIQTRTFKNKIDDVLVYSVNIGQFLKFSDQLYGVGIVVNSICSIWEGYWEYGNLYGQGRFISGEGCYYVGKFFKGFYSGQGVFCWKNGRKYEGEFNHSCRWGYGTQYNKDGDIEKQDYWNDGTFVWDINE